MLNGKLNNIPINTTQFTLSEAENLLSFDGEVLYFPNYLNQSTADYLKEYLFDSINWQTDQIKLYGKTIETKRKYAWMGDKEFTYNYSKSIRIAQTWDPLVFNIAQTLNKDLSEHFNSCLLNRYLDGSEAMGWHADNETCMLKSGTIASLSFGDTRTMVFKHKATGKQTKVNLEHGSLLLMRGVTQEHWLHQITKTTRSKNPRINLTFRTYVEIM